MTKLLTLAGAVLAAMLLAACGDDDTDDASGPIAQADAACLDAAGRFRDVNLEQGLDITPEEGLAKVEQTLPIRQEAMDAIAAIEPPADSPGWEEMITAREAALAAAEEQLAAFESGEQAEIDEANAALSEATEAHRDAAEAAGLTTCAGKISAEEAAAAEEALREFSTTNDPATSCDSENPEALVTEAFVEDGFGGQERCERQQEAIEGDLPTDIEVEETTGVDGVSATLDYEDVGGEFDGEPTTATLYFVDDGWRLYSIGPAQ